MRVMDADFVQGFIRMANNGWLQGWHERNGGNLSYRLTAEEACLVEDDLDPQAWCDLGICAAEVAGESFLITAAGSHFKNIVDKPTECMGIVQLDETGCRYRICWGFGNGGKPTSELPAHMMNQAARKAATSGANRVIYHSHPANIIAMTFVLPHDSQVFTRALWSVISECAIVFPQGVGVIDWMVPGSLEIAEASAKVMAHRDVVIWPYHGMFSAGASFDEAFGLLHTVEKAAEIFVKVQSMRAGSCASDELVANPGIGPVELKGMADAYDLDLDGIEGA